MHRPFSLIYGTPTLGTVLGCGTVGPLGGRQRGAGVVKGACGVLLLNIPWLGSPAGFVPSQQPPASIHQNVAFLPLSFCNRFQSLRFTLYTLDVIVITLIVNHSSMLYVIQHWTCQDGRVV